MGSVQKMEKFRFTLDTRSISLSQPRFEAPVVGVFAKILARGASRMAKCLVFAYQIFRSIYECQNHGNLAVIQRVQSTKRMHMISFRPSFPPSLSSFSPPSLFSDLANQLKKYSRQTGLNPVSDRRKNILVKFLQIDVISSLCQAFNYQSIRAIHVQIRVPDTKLT